MSAHGGMPIRSGRAAVPRVGRRGISSLEAIAALSILSAVMASTMPLFVRHLRLLADSRQERVALEELANQAELVRTLGADELAGFLARPPLSPRVARALPAPELTAEERGDGAVVLRLSWRSPGRAKSPVALAVWLPGAAGGEAGP